MEDRRRNPGGPTLGSPSATTPSHTTGAPPPPLGSGRCVRRPPASGPRRPRWSRKYLRSLFGSKESGDYFGSRSRSTNLCLPSSFSTPDETQPLTHTFLRIHSCAHTHYSDSCTLVADPPPPTHVWSSVSPLHTRIQSAGRTRLRPKQK